MKINKIFFTIAFSMLTVIGFSQEDNTRWEVGYSNTESAELNELSSDVREENSEVGNSEGHERFATPGGNPSSNSPIDQYTLILFSLGTVLLAGFAVSRNKLKNA